MEALLVLKGDVLRVKPAEHQGEKVHQPDAQHKVGNGHGDLGEYRHRPVHQPARPAGGDEPQWQGDKEDEDEGHRRQHQRDADFVCQELVHRHVIFVGLAEISGGEGGEPAPVPVPDGQVQAVPGAEHRDLLVGGLHPQHGAGRIAGNDGEGGESQRTHQQKGAQQQGQPLQ